ncbi:adhesive plaque matrix protein [Amyelois transitella]|uniref:adhesive plaque matrix protein n=1 Tax=Amyelois transitella TaxID=680683 RepID=UPI00298FC19C|nr:adhesive plaque matrix protein [Amyelois transitella]
MVRGAALALVLALAWACDARASVLVPAYALPPDSFVRDQRSLGPPPDTDTAESQRTIKRLIGGHMKNKEYSSVKNSISFDDKSESGKFNGVIAADQSGGTVGWNQGIWDDGMLMSSAGEGKENGKVKEDEEDKKTLSDQVAEGKYGLIQNEIFAKTPKRPGIISYEPNSETRTKDNLQSLGGLKKDEIWLAEDHLLVLKGGSFPERTKENERRPWPPIDDYEAPRRQVKLPKKPKVPPPFPVQLSDNGPLVFLTPNGSVPAALFPPFPAGEGEGPLPPPPFPFPPGAPYAPGDYPGNTTAGGAPLPSPPFPFLPGNASEGAFPFLPPMNGTFPEGFPPGAAFLPPPSNQSDLYDEDDPSIYYPPPYNFSYRADYNNSVPAGPLVPGIILPPPPDFFAPMEEKTTTETLRTNRPSTSYTRPTTAKPTLGPAVYRNKYKSRPTTTTTSTTETVRTTEVPSTISTPPTVEIITTPKANYRKPLRIPSRNPVRIQNLPDEVTTRPKTEKPVYKIRTKVTSKPLSVSVLYDYPDQIYDTKIPSTTEKPYVQYVTDKTPNVIINDIVTSTPVPLRAYYSSIQSDVPTTKLQPVYNPKPNDALASFYFFDEQPKTSPTPETYFDGRKYYKAVPVSQAPINQAPYVQPNVNPQSGFTPSVDVAYGAIDQADALFIWPQKQGPRTVTQEYFSIQKPRPQQVYVQQSKQRPDAFFQQIADIQQTIDLFTTKRPKAHSHRPHSHHKPKAITSRPVYQYYQAQAKPRPEQLTFRAPKLDPEPFRPMVSYSKPFNVENEFNAITPSVSPGYHQQYLIESIVTTESPTSSRYYPKSKTRDEDYDDGHIEKIPKGTRNHIPIQNDKPSVIQYINKQPSTTSNPIENGYYTKQDERYLDDITRNSFDIFGKKIEDNTHDVNGLAVTPPLETVKTPIDNNINIQYAYEIVESQTNPPSLDRDTLVNDRLPRPPVNPDSEQIQGHRNAELIHQKPPSLLDDTLVNERLPRPTINPDSEFIPIPNPGYRSEQYRHQSQVQRPQFAGEQYDLNRPSLGGDTAVNYRRPLPPINPDAEWIGPANPVNAAGEGRPGSFVSYRLPGEGAHVYFLTPQAARAARERFRAPGYGR